MIAVSEIGPKLLAVTDNGYNVIVGSTPAKPILFDSYADHPRRLIKINERLSSTAAGRYQLLARYFNHYRDLLDLPDFSPASQDAIALQQVKECRAFAAIEAGDLNEAVRKCAHIWASLPGAGYGQHENSIGILLAAYMAAGGKVA